MIKTEVLCTFLSVFMFMLRSIFLLTCESEAGLLRPRSFRERRIIQTPEIDRINIYQSMKLSELGGNVIRSLYPKLWDALKILELTDIADPKSNVEMQLDSRIMGKINAMKPQELRKLINIIVNDKRADTVLGF